MYQVLPRFFPCECELKRHAIIVCKGGGGGGGGGKPGNEATKLTCTFSVEVVDSWLSLPSPVVEQPSLWSWSTGTARLHFQYHYLACMSDSNSANSIAFHAEWGVE